MDTLWKKNRWISNPGISPQLQDKALKLEQLEQTIIATAGQSDIEKLVAQSMEEELKASFGIEGIRLDSMRIRSSIARNRGWIQNAWSPERQDSGKEARAVRAAIHMMRSGTYLTHEIIRECHAMLLQNAAGCWGQYRDHPESVFDESGQSVYDAPDAQDVLKLMDTFLEWWNQERPNLPLAIGSALGHLFFETVHPFPDGNGRVGRMLADKAWERTGAFRPFSVSAAILSDKNRYYERINDAQTKGMISEWIAYMLMAQESALLTALEKAKKLAAVRDWLVDAKIDASQTELQIIYEMSLANREYWTEFEATKYLPDDELAEKAWNRLVELGVIRDGQLHLITDATCPTPTP